MQTNKLFIILWMLLFYTNVVGQEISSIGVARMQSLLNMSLEELLDVEIIVASKNEESVFDAPSSVTVFTRQEILAMGITTMDELLNFVPGFISTREIVFGQGNMVAARGQTTPQASYNILFMLDGQRLNNELGGGALSEYNHFLSLFNVKRVEVIRGPGSALYGTSAFSGVVNIITTTDTNDAFVSFGNDNSREAYFNVSENEGKWNIAISGRHFKDEGQTYTDTLSDNNDFTQDPRQGQDAYVSLSYDKLRVNLRHQQRETSDFYVGRWPSSRDNQTDTQQNFIALNYELFDNEKWHVSLDASYMKMEQEMLSEFLSEQTVQNFPPSVTTTGNRAIAIGSIGEETEWQASIDSSYSLNEKHTLFAGLSWRRPKVVGFYDASNYNLNDVETAFENQPPAGNLEYYGNIVKNNYLLSGKSYRDIVGLYLQHKYKLNEKITTTLGVRGDRYSDVDSAANPRLALVYSHNDNTKFKLMYGEAFRAPSMRQLYISGIGNPDVKPEKIKTTELAWLQAYNRIQTKLTWFHSRSMDKLDTILVDNTDRLFFNLEGTLITAGWELEASTKWKGLSLRTAYTHLTKTEENPRRFPEQTFSLIANYQYDDWNFNLNTYYHSNIEQQVARQKITTLDSYWVTNTAIRYVLFDQVTLVGRANNLLDEAYFSSSKAVTFSEGVPNRGRSYSLGIEIQLR